MTRNWFCPPSPSASSLRSRDTYTRNAVVAVAGGFAPNQGVDQAVAPQDPVCVEQQDREQGSLLGCAELATTTVDSSPRADQESETQPAPAPRWRPYQHTRSEASCVSNQRVNAPFTRRFTARLDGGPRRTAQGNPETAGATGGWQDQLASQERQVSYKLAASALTALAATSAARAFTIPGASLSVPRDAQPARPAVAPPAAVLVPRRGQPRSLASQPADSTTLEQLAAKCPDGQAHIEPADIGVTGAPSCFPITAAPSDASRADPNYSQVATDVIARSQLRSTGSKPPKPPSSAGPARTGSASPGSSETRTRPRASTAPPPSSTGGSRVDAT